MVLARHTEQGLTRELERGLRYLEEEQLPSGEIPNFRLLANGSWEYCFSPLPSVYVHDALSCFDLLSLWFDPQAVDQVESSSRTSFLRTAMRLRRRALRFLAWQQSSDLRWRFHGLGSGLAPDADLTAMAGTALVEVRGRDRAHDWSQQTASIRSFRREDGLYGDAESHVERLIASANVLRYYALTGEMVEQLEYLLDHQLKQGIRGNNRIAFLWTLARACRQGHLALLTASGNRIVAELLDYQESNGSFGGPLSTALAMHALLDFEYEGPELLTGRDALLNWLDPIYGRRYEGFGHNGCGSSAWTTISIVTALAKGARQ